MREPIRADQWEEESRDGKGRRWDAGGRVIDEVGERVNGLPSDVVGSDRAAPQPRREERNPDYEEEEFPIVTPAPLHTVKSRRTGPPDWLWIHPARGCELTVANSWCQLWHHKGNISDDVWMSMKSEQE